MLSQENLKRIEDLRGKYPTAQAVILPALWIAQEQEGYVGDDMMQEIAGLLQVPFGHVLGVVTFYTMFNAKPVGKRHIEVCTNVSCMLRGSAKILDHIQKRLGIAPGQTSGDKKWTLSEVECMGSCGTAPMLAIGDEYHENLTIERVDRLLDSLK